MSHAKYMRVAIKLAADGARSGRGGPFGCVIVRRGRIVGRGCNQVTSAPDPTAHAEIVAIRAAAARLGSHVLADCVLYTSCEPCPMCLAAICWAHIPAIYYANTRADAAAIGFDDAVIGRELARPRPISVRLRPLLRREAQAAFQEWQRDPAKQRY